MRACFTPELQAGLWIAIVSTITVSLVSAADARPKAKRYHAVQRTAAVTGLAASHSMRREGNRLCFADHYHYGASMGRASQRDAQVAAAKAWADFVDLEYGGTWANFGAASSKDFKCAQSTAGWGCELSARPCR